SDGERVLMIAVTRPFCPASVTRMCHGPGTAEVPSAYTETASGLPSPFMSFDPSLTCTALLGRSGASHAAFVVGVTVVVVDAELLALDDEVALGDELELLAVLLLLPPPHAAASVPTSMSASAPRAPT